MEKFIGNKTDIQPHLNTTVVLQSSNPRGNISSTVDKDTVPVHPLPGPDAATATIATMDVNRLWLFSESEGAKSAREDVETLIKQLQFLNGPEGEQIFNVLEQLILEWAAVLEELTRAEGKFAKDKDLPGNPQLVIRAGMTAVKKFEKVAARYKAMSDLAITFECIFAKAEGFNRLLSNDTKTVGCTLEPEVKKPAGDNGNYKLSKYPLHCQQLKILAEVIVRMRALTMMINQKLVQMGAI